MEHTVSLKENYEFRRLYAKGKSAVTPCLAVYCRKNRREINRIGFSTGTKLGKAVVRNRVRRRLREAYRLHEGEISLGYDLVVAARVRCAHVRYGEMERQLLLALDKLGLREAGRRA